MALTAMKSMRQRLGRQGGLTYEVEVVAQHAADLGLPPGTRAMFVLKRRHRLCVTEPEAVDGAGGVEWNTRCTQTATLYKEGGGGSSTGGWRPKEFVFKVQAVRDHPRLGQEQAQTVAKAAVDLSQFCTAELTGPKQLVVPLQPRGVLSVSIRTQWLQHFDRENDTLTDISYLSLGQSVATSVAGSAQLRADEQDLSGFDGSAAAAAAAAGPAPGQGGGNIRAVYPPSAAAAPAAPAVPPLAGSSPPALKKRVSVAAVLRLPRRTSSAKEQQQPDGFDFGRPATAAGSADAAAVPPATLHRSAAAPAASLSGAGRRPVGASLLVIPEPAGQGVLAADGGSAEADTPTFFVRQQPNTQQSRQPQQPKQQGQLHQAAMGLPPEAWSPINLQEAVAQLYDSEEEPTPKPLTVLATVKRIFGRGRNVTPVPPGTTARQLHATFGTPQPTPPRCTPDPSEVATVDRENSVAALRRRCKRLMAERDEARAEGFAEAALAVEQSVEIDKLMRSKDMLLQRLHTTEQQLLATYRDEASSDLIQALAAERVEGAQRDYQIMELQGQLRKKEALVDRLRAQLTRAETKYRSSINALTPGRKGGPPSPWSASPSAGAAGGRPLPDSPFASTGGAHARAAAAGQQQQRQQGHLDGSPHALPLRLHDNPLALSQQAAAAVAQTAVPTSNAVCPPAQLRNLLQPGT